jgi:hypothetical protein
MFIAKVRSSIEHTSYYEKQLSEQQAQDQVRNAILVAHTISAMYQNQSKVGCGIFGSYSP